MLKGGGGREEGKQSEMGKDVHMVSRTLVDYQRPSWYLLGCFSLKKKPEISITRTNLMI